MKLFRATLALLAAAGASALSVGDKVPVGHHLDFGFPPERVDVTARLAGRRTIVVGLPGAFTPT